MSLGMVGNTGFKMEHYYQALTENLFKLSAVFEEDFLNLTIFKDETAWNVNIPKDEIIEQSKDDFNEYYANLKRYLRSCPQDVEFSFKHGKLTIHLLLKNKMKILFFTSTLKQVNFVENVFYLVDKLYKDKTQYFEELSNLQKQYRILQEDNQNFEKKIDIFLERQKTEEKKLYSKFVAVLNEKKQHIQHLNDLIIAFRKGRPSVNSSVNNNKQKKNQPVKNAQTKKSKQNINTVCEPDHSSSLSDNSYNTDDEEANQTDEASSISRNSKTKFNTPVPSTSKTNFSFIEDPPTSLFQFSKRIRTDNLNSSVHLPESNKRESKITVDPSKTNSEFTSTVKFSTQDLLDNI